MSIKSMTMTAAVINLPSARQQGILLKPSGGLPGAAYVWRRVFLKGGKRAR